MEKIKVESYKALFWSCPNCESHTEENEAYTHHSFGYDDDDNVCVWCGDCQSCYKIIDIGEGEKEVVSITKDEFLEI